MANQIIERFKKWYTNINGPISVMTPCKEAYIQGSRDQFRHLAEQISGCVTYQEIMDMLRKEYDSMEG